MSTEDNYAKLTERMREIERVQNILDDEYSDGFKKTRHLHLEIRKSVVTEEQYLLIKAILDSF